MSQPKAFYRIESFNGGYVIIRSLGNKVEKITTEDTLPHTLAKLGILITTKASLMLTNGLTFSQIVLKK